MAVTVIDKIKQKNSGTFKLLDAIDIHGRITGWQNPVKNIFDNVSAITGLTNGDFFIVRDAGGTWSTFTGLDIYGNAVSVVNNGIYYVDDEVEGGEAYPVKLVTAPTLGMMLINLADGTLKKYGNIPANWENFTIGGSTGISGQSLRYSEELTILIGTNYSSTTKELSLGTTLVSGDNVNVYVNGLKYSHVGSAPEFSFTANTTYLVWSVSNAGFDLANDDSIEIEVFNNE